MPLSFQVYFAEGSRLLRTPFPWEFNSRDGQDFGVVSRPVVPRHGPFYSKCMRLFKFLQMDLYPCLNHLSSLLPKCLWIHKHCTCLVPPGVSWLSNPKTTSISQRIQGLTREVFQRVRNQIQFFWRPVPFLEAWNCSFYIKGNSVNSKLSSLSPVVGSLCLWLVDSELHLLFDDDYMALVISAFYLPKDVNEFRICNDCAAILPVLKSFK